MSWHAVDAVDNAVEATRRFLFPFSLVRWAKLALLVLLMGGGVSANASVFFAPDGDGIPTGEVISAVDGLLGAAGTNDSGLIAGFSDGALLTGTVLVLLMLIGTLSIVSLGLRLVFYDALHTNTVRLWRPFVSRLRQALGLFAVSTAIWIAASVPVTLAVLVAVGSESPIGWDPLDSLVMGIASLSAGPAVAVGIVGAAFALLAALALRFTYEFVVPTMIVEDSGVIAGWGRIWGPLGANRADVVVYLAVHFLLGIGISILEGLVVALVGGAVVVTAGLVLLVVAGALGGFGSLIGTSVGLVSVGSVVVVALVALLLLFVPVRIVTRSYLISYEVATLGGFDRSLSVLHPDIDPATPASDDPATPTSDLPGSKRSR